MGDGWCAPTRPERAEEVRLCVGAGRGGARSIGAPPEEAPAALGGGRSRAPAAPRALVSPDGSRR